MRVVLAASEVNNPGQVAERLVLARSLLAQEELAEALVGQAQAAAFKELLPKILRSPYLAFLEPIWATRATMAAAAAGMAL